MDLSPWRRTGRNKYSNYSEIIRKIHLANCVCGFDSLTALSLVLVVRTVPDAVAPLRWTQTLPTSSAQLALQTLGEHCNTHTQTHHNTGHAVDSNTGHRDFNMTNWGKHLTYGNTRSGSRPSPRSVARWGRCTEWEATDASLCLSGCRNRHGCGQLKGGSSW